MGVLFGILMSFFVDVFSKLFLHAVYKIAITLVAIGIIVGIIYAYVSGYSAIVTALGQSVPTIASGVWSWVMPPNAGTCIFYLFSSVLMRFTTIQVLKVVGYKFKAAISN